MKTIYYSYKETGIQTLRAIAWVILALGLLATLISFINCFITVGNGRYSSEVLFSWGGLVNTILILAATLFGTGISLVLSYLGESALFSQMQFKELLVEKGIELEFQDEFNEVTVIIQHKEIGERKRVSLAYWETFKNTDEGQKYELIP